jgi:phytoene dehydrogenase-like protein
MVSEMKARPSYVTFELRSVEDREKSIEAGHVVFKDVAYAVITPQGGNLVVDREVTPWLADLHKRGDENAEHYEKLYEAWKAGNDAPVDGTRVQDWPSITPAQVDQLKHAHCLSVEDLAAANEGMLSRIGMGGRALKQKAQAWLDSANNTGKAAEELQSLRILTEEQSETIETMKAKIAALEAAQNVQKSPRKKKDDE